jgi:hypothetical protein
MWQHYPHIVGFWYDNEQNKQNTHPFCNLKTFRPKFKPFLKKKKENISNIPKPKKKRKPHKKNQLTLQCQSSV